MTNMSVSRAFQAAIVDRLRTDADVSEALRLAAGVNVLNGNRVFDGVPADTPHDYVAIGPSSSVDADTDCLPAEEETLQIDVFSRQDGRVGPCKDIVSAVRAALHRASLTLANGHAAALRVVLTRVMMDPDGRTAHGVVHVRCVLEA